MRNQAAAVNRGLFQHRTEKPAGRTRNRKRLVYTAGMDENLLIGVGIGLLALAVLAWMWQRAFQG